MGEVIANDDLECLTTEATHTTNFVDNELTNTYKAISDCLDALADTVFAGPVAESSREGLNDFLRAIKNPIMVNFNNIITSLTDAHEILTETDEKVKNTVSFVYDKQKGFKLNNTTNGLVGNSIPDKIFNFLLSKGYNNAAACAILSNIQAESSFNFNSIGDNGTSYGLCQWHNSRWSNLQNYCNQKGLDWRSLEGQMEYLVYELGTNYSWVNSYLKNVPNTSEGAYNAAYKWTTDFEVCADANYWGTVRGQNASSTFWQTYGNVSRNN